MKKVIRSPFFYVGDKYKLMSQLIEYIPDDIERFYEPFMGGGSSFLNIKAKEYYLNDFDKKIVLLHKFLYENRENRERFYSKLFCYIDDFDLSCSYIGKNVDPILKKNHVKTYYAVHNKKGYNILKEYYNQDPNDLYALYLLLIYGFNHFLRFNSKGIFNLPVGNVDFNKNVMASLNHYFDFSSSNKVNYFDMDFRVFIASQNIDKNCYVYFDPPYLVSMSEYNKLWKLSDEIELYEFIDNLNNKGVKFGLSNMISHKGRVNETFEKWSRKYLVYEISSNYISHHDNSIKHDSKEVFVTNYDKKANQKV